MKMLQPHVTKNGGSMFTLVPNFPSMLLATCIRRNASEARVASAGMAASLKEPNFLITSSLYCASL